MRTLFLFLIIAACGKKTVEPTIIPEQNMPVQAKPVEEAVEEPVVEEKPVEPAPPATNADFKAVVTMADGTAKSGHVKLIERSTDWYAEEDWTSDASELKLSLETDSEMRSVTWKDISSVKIVVPKVSDSTDCTYDSDYTPWMYDCTLKTTGEAVTTDGKSWKIETRNKWRFTFDDDSTVEFWLKKYPSRMQDTRTVQLSDATGENYDLYIELQDRLREDVKTMPIGIKITH